MLNVVQTTLALMQDRHQSIQFLGQWVTSIAARLQQTPIDQFAQFETLNQVG